MKRLSSVVAGIIVLTCAVAVDAAVRSLDASDLRAEAATVGVGELVRIDGFTAGESARREIFVGRRFEVFAPDARLVVVDEAGEHDRPVPANVYFAGSFEDIGESKVLLSVLETGVVRGIASDSSGAWMILPSGPAGTPEIRRIDSGQRARPFQCDESLLERARDASFDRHERLPLALSDAPNAAPPAHTARIAVDTDFEFFQRFNDVPAAANYAADLIAFMSILYEAEVDTSMQLTYLRLFVSANDPWTESSPLCNLFQFGKFWNDHATPPVRTIFHMMSGKNNGGGVAWRGVLCNGPFNYDATGQGCGFTGVSNYGGDYGYTGDMDGNFLYENPGVLWDIVATSHEIGHNFSSPHTHCYGNIGGNPNPVDACYNGECGGSGCSCAPQTLPGPGSLTGGSSGMGNGTIMSYCHLLAGGFGNITYTLGTGHPFGVAPGRVPIQMMAEVAAASCMSFVPGTSVIFRDGVDQGSTSNWSSVIP